MYFMVAPLCRRHRRRCRSPETSEPAAPPRTSAARPRVRSPARGRPAAAPAATRRWRQSIAVQAIATAPSITARSAAGVAQWRRTRAGGSPPGSESMPMRGWIDGHGQRDVAHVGRARSARGGRGRGKLAAERLGVAPVERRDSSTSWRTSAYGALAAADLDSRRSRARRPRSSASPWPAARRSCSRRRAADDVRAAVCAGTMFGASPPW